MTGKPVGHFSKNQSGVSLVEVAVAVLVLSIGALGLASLQISAKRAGFEAMQRTEASALAMDIFERMRANSGVLGDYATAGVGAAVRTLPAAPSPTCVGETACTSAQLVAWDLWEWERALNGGTTKDAADNSVGSLVRPTGCITFDALVPRLVTVEIAWEGGESLNNDAAGTRCGTGSCGTNDVNRQLLQMTSYVGE
jgi:type IV pilus assembly protein PilV